MQLFRSVLHLLAVALCSVVVYSTPQRHEAISAHSKGVHISLSSLAESLQNPSKALNPAYPVLNKGRIQFQDKLQLPLIAYYISVPATGEISASFTQLSMTPVSSALTTATAAQMYQPEVRIRRMGIMRGVHIASVEIQPLQAGGVYAVASILDNAEIDIRFEKEVQAMSDADAPLSSLANSYCDKSINNGQTPPVQEVVSWYDPAKKYLRISTTRDGVAALRAQELINRIPEMAGERTQFLHLLYNGVEQALYTEGDDGFIDKNDVWHFAGKRAAGDTTWFSPFSKEAVFYLYYDASVPGKRYTSASLTPGAEELFSVDVLRHIEEENDYNQSIYVGNDYIHFHNTETVQGERWIWQNVDRFKNFRYDAIFTPAENVAVTPMITVHYNSINNFIPANPDHRLRFFLNDMLMADETYEGAQERVFRAELPLQQFGAGLVSLNISSVGTPDNENSEKEAVDYIELQGKEKAFAQHGSYYCSASVGSPHITRVSNLQSATVRMIDTERQTAFTAKAVPGTSVRASVRKQSPSIISLIINDSVIVHLDRAALTVCALQAPEYTKVTTWYGSNDDESVETFLKSIASQSVVAVLMNGNTNLSTAMKEYLSRHGQSSLALAAPNECGIALLRNGVNASLKERSHIQLASMAEFIPHDGGASWQAVFPVAAGENTLLITSENRIENAAVTTVSSSNLRQASLGADYIVITHPEFATQAKRLADYRAAQGWRTALVSVEDIYKEFGGGQKSPHVIKEFLRYAYTTWQKPAPKYLLLVGDASWDPRQIPPLGLKKDFVPTYGKPVSDYWYTMLEGDDVLPEMCVGRIPCETVTQAEAVINKILEYDTVKPQPWWKRFLFVSGGSGEAEEKAFYEQMITDIAAYLSYNILLCGDTISAASFRKNEYGVALPTHIVNTINSGVLWVNYVGHGAPDLTEIPGWDAPVLNNKGRYPLLATFSCQNGAFGEREVTARNEAYLLASERGSVASMGTSGYGTIFIDASLNSFMFSQLSINKVRRVGDMLQEAKLDLHKFQEAPYLNTLLQYSLLGDPLTRVPIDTNVHPYILRQEVRIRGRKGEEFITEDLDSAALTFRLHNAGMCEERPVPLMVLHEYNGVTDTLRQTLNRFCYTEDMAFLLQVLGNAGVHTLRIIIDPDNTLLLGDREQRTFVYDFTVYSRALLPVDPLAYWDVNAKRPRFRVVNPLGATKELFSYEASLRKQGESTDLLRLEFGTTTDLDVQETHIEWKPDIELQADERYLFIIRYKNIKDNKPSPFLTIPFRATAVPEDHSVVIKEVTATDFSKFEVTGFRRIDETEGSRFMLNYMIPASVLSAYGKAYYKDGNLIREILSAIDMNVGSSTYPGRYDYRGISYVLFPRNDTSIDKRRYNRIDVGYDSTFTRRAAYYFLRDSIPDNYYVLIGTCESIYFREKVDTYFDSIRIALKNLGSGVSDSLVEPNAYSGIILRDKGVGQVLTEGFRAFDTVKVAQTLRMSPDSGSLRSPFYGPAKQWQSLNIQATIPPSVAEVSVQIWGTTDPAVPGELVMLNPSLTMNLSSIDAARYPYLRFVVDVHRKSYDDDPVIGAWTLRYQPIAELAVLPSQLKVLPDGVLRGDSTLVQAALTVISPRVPVESAQAQLRFTPLEGTWESPVHLFTSGLLQPDAPWWLYDTVDTRTLSTRTQIDLIANPTRRVAELYSFNNSTRTTMSVMNDTAAPDIRIYFDGVEAYNGMYVAQQPTITIVSDDNSRIVLTDSASLKAKLNAFTVSRRNARDYQLSFGADVRTNTLATTATRALLQFADTLDIGINNLSVTAIDVFGNKREKALSVNVSKFIKLLSTDVYPNPFGDKTTIRYNFEGQQQNLAATIIIYDVNGRQVRTLRNATRLGENNLSWDGRNEEGESLSQGVYLYTVYLDTLGTENALHGLMLLAR